MWIRRDAPSPSSSWRAPNAAGPTRTTLLNLAPSGDDMVGIMPDSTEHSQGDEAHHRLIITMMQAPHDGSQRGSVSYGVFGILRDLIDDATSPLDKDRPIDVDLWLHSPGGDAHAAYKIMLLLRNVARTLRVVVPDYAKSAATLMALGADELVMGPAAELGPLDAQIYNEDLGTQHSALDVARAVEHLGEVSMSLVVLGGSSIIRATGLSRRDTMTGMLKFASDFMQPLTSQIDPRLLHRSNSLLRVASEYAARLLSMRAGSVPYPDPALAENLTEIYPDHGFIISRNEARHLGLPIVDIEDYDLAAQVEESYRNFEESEYTALSAHIWENEVSDDHAQGTPDETLEEPEDASG